MRKIPLHWQIIIGLLLGVLFALLSGFLGWSEFTKLWIAPWGRIFISLLKLIAIPLVLFSIVSGIAGLGSPAQLGRLGLKTMTIYLITTIIAVSIGLSLVNLIKPGSYVNQQLRETNYTNYKTWLQDKSNGNELDLSKKEQGDLKTSISIDIEPTKLTNDKPLDFIEEMVPSNVFGALSDNSRMLQIIFFAILFGIAILYIPSEKSAHIILLVNGLADVFIKMVEMVMKIAPFFVFALMAGVINEQAGNNPFQIIEIFKGLGGYTLTVVLGLALVGFVVYPLFVNFFIKGISYRDFIRGISPAQLLAFSTSSSAATLPVTIECVEQNLKVDKNVASFVLPIGATINMDGTSLYQAVAVVFLAQFNGIELEISQQLVILLTATLASIGAAAIPSAGIVTLMVVLSSVGLNPAWIAIILPVDRILDMMRTVINVTGDALVALIIDRSKNKQE